MKSLEYRRAEFDLMFMFKIFHNMSEIKFRGSAGPMGQKDILPSSGTFPSILVIDARYIFEVTRARGIEPIA